MLLLKLAQHYVLGLLSSIPGDPEQILRLPAPTEDSGRIGGFGVYTLLPIALGSCLTRYSLFHTALQYGLAWLFSTPVIRGRLLYNANFPALLHSIHIISALRFCLVFLYHLILGKLNSYTTCLTFLIIYAKCVLIPLLAAATFKVYSTNGSALFVTSCAQLTLSMRYVFKWLCSIHVSSE